MARRGHGDAGAAAYVPPPAVAYGADDGGDSTYDEMNPFAGQTPDWLAEDDAIDDVETPAPRPVIRSHPGPAQPAPVGREPDAARRAHSKSPSLPASRRSHRPWQSPRQRSRRCSSLPSGEAIPWTATAAACRTWSTCCRGIRGRTGSSSSSRRPDRRAISWTSNSTTGICKGLKQPTEQLGAQMAGRALAVAELLVLLAAPLLLFPTYRPAWTVVALALLAAVCAARLSAVGVLARFPANLALLVFCLAIPWRCGPRPSLVSTLPKLTGLILGCLAARVGVRRSQPPVPGDRACRVWDRRAGACGPSACWACAWRRCRPHGALFPRRSSRFPGTPGEGVNPNQLAGARVLALPVMLGVLQDVHARAGAAVLLLAACWSCSRP